MTLYLNELKYFYPCTLKKRSLQKFLRYSMNKNNRKSYRLNEKNEKSFWKTFCERSSIHGIRFVVSDELHHFEKIIWSCVLIFAVIATIYVSIILSRRFSDNLLATVVDSTIFPVYEIPFPAVTICNYNRINWKRIQEAEKKFLPSSSGPELSDLFRRFLATFHDFEYGNFDNYEGFENTSLDALDMINLSEVADFLSYKCEELFVEKCWWRNRYIPCCELFSKQKSEYGFCYSFNSVTNDVGRRKAEIDSNWPWRTSISGEWSGLRTQIKLDPSDKPPGSKQFSGIMVLINHPEEWPTNGVFVPAGTASFVILRAKLSYAEAETRRLKPEIRQCIFQDEVQNYGYKTLPGLKYLIGNCISNCRRQYTMRYCNCSVEFFFPDDDFRICTASDFHCLYKYSGIFSYEKSFEEEMYINSTGQGMICSCIHQCYAIDYKAEVTPFYLTNNSAVSNGILLDVHFQRNTLLKYRTNIVFGWIDLLVGFGGIAGLFLGCSLISGFEILYYMTISLGLYWKKLYSDKIKSKTDLKKSKKMMNEIFISNTIFRRNLKLTENFKRKY